MEIILNKINKTDPTDQSEIIYNIIDGFKDSDMPPTIKVRHYIDINSLYLYCLIFKDIYRPCNEIQEWEQEMINLKFEWLNNKKWLLTNKLKLTLHHSITDALNSLNDGYIYRLQYEYTTPINIFQNYQENV